MEVFFYEAFAEEAEYLQQYLSPGIAAGFTRKTIQEHGTAEPPAGLISIRTQSSVPVSWAVKLAGILTRSTGYDHLEKYRGQENCNLPCGHLPPYCSRAVAEQAMLLWTALLRNLPGQSESFASFNRDGLTGWECEGNSLRDGRSSHDEEVANTLELAGRPNVICTPHNAFNTHEAIARKSKLSIEQINYFLKNGEFLRPVPREIT